MKREATLLVCKLRLDNYILKIGSKNLSSVDIPSKGSHQHEIGIPERACEVFEPDSVGLDLANFHFFTRQNRFLLEDVEVVYYKGEKMVDGPWMQNFRTS